MINLLQPAPIDWYNTRSDLPHWILDILYQRLGDINKINNFLNPRYEDLYSPYLFLDMQKVVDRIFDAIIKKEKICIYADYDADAVTASAVMIRGLRYLGADVTYYIPDRFSEGYGVNKEAIQKIIEQGSKLVMTVDCGTNSDECAEYAESVGVSFVVTDHHEMLVEKFNCSGIVNPKAPFETYPEKQVTGVGVAFKVIHALYQDARVKEIKKDFIDGYEKWLLDLVAIGTVADCHSLLGENRILVGYGLKVLQKTKWIGLSTLLNQGSEVKVDEKTLGFYLAPRINAAGRLAHASLALDLLLTDSAEEAVRLTSELEEINNRRKILSERIASEAKEQALSVQKQKIYVLHHPSWHKGVVGLVASRLVNDLSAAVIVLEEGDGELTGSARTYGSIDVVDALRACSQYLSKFGGHKQAAGLTVKKECLEDFKYAIVNYIEDKYDNIESVVDVACVINEDLSSYAAIDYFKKLSPFGVGNEVPKFLLQNYTLLYSKAVGQDGKHLQFNIKVGSNEVKGIAFSFSKSKLSALENGSDIVCELKLDSFNSKEQLKIFL